MWDAKLRGVSFDRVLTLGHQSLKLFPSEVDYFRHAYRQQFNSSVTPLDGHSWEAYVDGFLRDFLGARSITVLDASPYEGAETIHDLNTPVPADWHGKYDAVIDGGTLEHIFNVPTAFANVAALLAVGGTAFLNTPANNMMGHGFYQFSPELMFRVFSEENGFAIRNVLLYEAGYPSVELTKKDTVYKVIDPDAARQRVGLLNAKPVIMMVEAVKTHDTTVFALPPLQSDYVAMWESDGAERKKTWRRKLTQAVHSLPIVLRAPLLGQRQKRQYSLRNRDLYTRERWLSKDHGLRIERTDERSAPHC